MTSAGIFSLSPYIREAGTQGNDEWPTRPRRIYDHQFFYCFKGKGSLKLGEKLYELKAGVLFVIPPDTPHCYALDKQNPCDCYWFHCDLFPREDREWPFEYYNEPAQYLKLFGPRLLHRRHIRPQADLEGRFRIPEYLETEEPEAMEQYFRNIHQAYLSGSAVWQISANADFYQILAAVFRQQSNETKQSTKALHQVNLMRSFIRENYFRKLRVKDITDVTVYSSDYAAKIFKEVTGMSVNDYLTNFRITRAKRLLLDLDLSISDIAEMCGFSDESYFASVIRAKEGMSPSQLRDVIISSVKGL